MKRRTAASRRASYGGEHLMHLCHGRDYLGSGWPEGEPDEQTLADMQQCYARHHDAIWAACERLGRPPWIEGVLNR